MEKNCCAFTGHRPAKLPWKYDEADSRCVALKEAIAGQIIRLVDRGVVKFLSGMAQGTDIWAAEAVLVLREKNPTIKLCCVLPCEDQEIKWENSAKERYHSILKQADSVEYVSREYHKNCMLDRNQRMVDSAAFLLAVYNGEYRGGTAATMHYAQKLGREIWTIDPITRQVAYMI